MPAPCAGIRLAIYAPKFEADFRLVFQYSPFELSCALRPVLHHTILTTMPHQGWLYVDGDTWCHAPIDDVLDSVRRHAISLSPQRMDRNFRYEMLHLRYGLYNGGFHRLVYAQRLFFDGLDASVPHVTNGLVFGDQNWLNYVPLYYRNVNLIADPGINCAWWRIDSSDALTRVGGEIRFAGSRSAEVSVLMMSIAVLKSE